MVVYGLHAKVYVVERDNRAHLFIGSANVVRTCAWGGNDEILVELVGKVGAFGVAATVGHDGSKVTATGLPADPQAAPARRSASRRSRRRPPTPTGNERSADFAFLCPSLERSTWRAATAWSDSRSPPPSLFRNPPGWGDAVGWSTHCAGGRASPNRRDAPSIIAGNYRGSRRSRRSSCCACPPGRRVVLSRRAV